jgi:hypothetical protein
MSKLEVNAVEPQCGTNLTLGASGDTIIIPSGATISNQGTAAGFGPTGAVSWDTTKKTTGFTAVTGVGYFCDTTSAAFTVTLPATPSAGAVVGICDYANTFATNNLTIDRNGSKIGGVSANATISTNGVSVTFVYVDSTQGWIVTDSGNRSDLPAPQYIVATGGTVTCCGDYKIHTFTGPGTFTVCSAGNSLGSNTVDYLVVAGGGGAGNSNGGGGGAGGYRESKSPTAPWTASPLASSTSLPVSATGYPITVGSGGAGQPGPQPQALGKGISGNSSIFSTITSAGGGGGGSGLCTGPGNNAVSGGSGGGGGTNGGLLGAGNTPPTSPSQGNSGSNGGGPTSPISYQSGGGGGGAGAAGVTITPSPQKAGDGGAGVTSSINATPTARAGGGGGGASPGTTAGSGGSGGGGAGSISGTGTSGTVNTGGGGGGGSGPGPGAGGAGGSGIVIIRYKYQ